MKTLKLLLMASVLCSHPVFSQQEIPLCKAFDLLIKSAPSNFSDYQGAKTNTDPQSKEYRSTLEIAGAKSSTINGLLNYYSFHSDFGKYATDEEATKVLKKLQAEFITCKPDFEFVFQKDNVINQYNYYLVNKHAAGLRFYNAYFNKRQVGNQFTVTFAIQKTDLLREYIYLTNEPDYNQKECKEVRIIVEASKEKFERLKGELTNNGYIEYYKSLLCITGLQNCRIYPVNVFHKIPTFDVVAGANLTKDQAKQLMENVTRLIAMSLGKRYAVGSAKDGELITFCLKDDTGKNEKDVAAIILNKSSGLENFMQKGTTYSVKLEFYTVN
ncbi:hypothetical protein GALL_56810 [mine drainage metagenome]|uniref:Uncharacterized protein n=1 Tax=mine drainage metagenome TaxID=410659 RepID=A0A1J5TAP0_9ZZZZ